MDKKLRFLGLAKKAGSLAIGDEAVYSATTTGKARAVFSAKDASNNTKRRAARLAESSGAEYVQLPYDKSELGELVGRSEIGVLSVTDVGIASNFMQKLAEESPEQYGDPAANLAKKAARKLTRQKNRKTAHRPKLKGSEPETK